VRGPVRAPPMEARAESEMEASAFLFSRLALAEEVAAEPMASPFPEMAGLAAWPLAVAARGTAEITAAT
jgi:hypothetical protein